MECWQLSLLDGWGGGRKLVGRPTGSLELRNLWGDRLITAEFNASPRSLLGARHSILKLGRTRAQALEIILVIHCLFSPLTALRDRIFGCCNQILPNICPGKVFQLAKPTPQSQHVLPDPRSVPLPLFIYVIHKNREAWRH